MISTPFQKWHGLGNDFVIAFAEDTPLPDAPTVQQLADRHTGIGFDQFLWVYRQRDGAGFKILNADGSYAEQCGNGARCVARAAQQRWGLADTFTLHTDLDAMPVVLAKDGVQVQLKPPEFFDHVRVPGVPNGQAVDLGNPHYCIAVPDVGDVPLAAWAEQIQRSGTFPDGVNVGIYTPSDATLQLRVFERGADETQACGSGACAAAVAWLRQQSGAVRRCSVRQQGGTLTIDWSGSGEAITMTGPATKVFTGAY